MCGSTSSHEQSVFDCWRPLHLNAPRNESHFYTSHCSSLNKNNLQKLSQQLDKICSRPVYLACANATLPNCCLKKNTFYFMFILICILHLLSSFRLNILPIKKGSIIIYYLLARLRRANYQHGKRVKECVSVYVC